MEMSKMVPLYAVYAEDRSHQSSATEVSGRDTRQSAETETPSLHLEEDKTYEVHYELEEEYKAIPESVQEESASAPSERRQKDDAARKILSAVDEAGFSLFHLKTACFCGLGFMTDAYDFFCINMLTKLIGRLYYTTASCTKSNLTYTCTIAAPGTLSIRLNATVSTVSLAGALLGQLVGGRAADLYGRKTIYIASLIIMIATSLCSGMSYGGSPDAVVGTLCFWRFLLGFGVGANYPTTAVAISEYSNVARRGTMIAAVFAMQAIGYLFTCTVVIVVLAIFDSFNPSVDCSTITGGHCYPLKAVSVDQQDALAAVWTLHSQVIKPSDDMFWRVIVSLGAVPALISLLYTLRVPETARFTALVRGRTHQAAADMDALMRRTDIHLFAAHLADGVAADAAAGIEPPPPALMPWADFCKCKTPNFLVQMLGCAGTWFFLDVAFYSQGLFQNDVFTSIGWIPSNKDMTGLGEVSNIARAQALIALTSTVPGVLATVYTVELLGRRGIQLMGFFFMTALMALLSGFYSQLLNGALPSFLGMYCLTFFFANFGPNTTTYMLPAELFPAHLRCTCYGICAAAGKAGALLGATGFLYASQSTKGSPAGIGLQPALGILAATNFLGLVMTVLWTPETRGKTLEELCAPEVREPPPPPGPIVFWGQSPRRAPRRRSLDAGALLAE